MKKLIYITLAISVIFQAFVGILFESNREIQELKNDESNFCISFAIPDDKDISNSEKLFSVFLQTSEETHVNLFRTYLRGNNSYVEVVKYILLAGDSKYNQTFKLKSGTPLTLKESRSRDCKLFLSTQNSGDKEQTGKLRGHMYNVDVSVHPFYQMFSVLKGNGRYDAELPAGYSKEAFLKDLQKNLKKAFNKEISLQSLEGDSQNVAIPKADEVLFQSVYYILLLLQIVFLLYSLFRESKQIAVLKLNGVSTGKILWLFFKDILGAFSGTLVFVALAISLYTGEWPYAWQILKNSIGIYILTLVLLLLIVGANIHACRVYQNLNGKSNSKSVFCLNMAVKALSVLLILALGQSVYTNFKDYRKEMDLYKAWGDASYYGIFDSFSAGSTITMEDMIQAEGKIGKDVYPVLNRQGSLFINARDFQPEYLNQPSQKYPSVKVNPNYLKKYPLLDSAGEPVTISESEVNWILLAPEHYKKQEEKLTDYFKTIRSGMNDVDRQEYGASAKESKGRYVKIIWIKDGQKIYSFNSKVSPETAGTLQNVLVQVMTEQNSCISDRECVNGNGDSDALKVKLSGTQQETYDALLPTLKQAGVAENLTRLVVLDQYTMEKATQAKNQMNLYLLMTLVLVAVLLLIIIQNMIILFDRNKKDIVVKKLFGWRWNQRFGKYMGISISVSVIMLCFYWIFCFVTGSANLGYLLGSSLLLLATEITISFITILRTESRKVVDTLKGE